MAELRPVPARGARARRARARAPRRRTAGRARVGARGARRRGAHPGRVDRAAAAAVLRVHRVVGARDRRDRRPARAHVRHQPGRRRARRHADRAAGRALGERVRRLPGDDRRVHERRDDQQRDRARGGPGAGAAGCPAPRACRDAGSTVYCSAEVHYSITRAVELLGIGSNNLRDLPIDEARRLRPDALAEALDADIAAGIIPVAVVATAGTTLTGAIDPIDEIADVCAERGVWLHVDGAYGVPAASVPTHAVAVPRHRARRLGLGRRAQVALPAEGVRASSWSVSRDASPRRSRTSRATCRTSSTSCTRWTSRSSTRGRSGR